MRTPCLVLTLLSGCAAAPDPTTPDGALRAFSQHVGDGDLAALWKTLPASFQREAEQLVTEFAARFDPDVWDRAMDLARRYLVVIRERRSLIAASFPSEQRDELEQRLDHVLTLIDTLIESDLGSGEGLRNLDVPSFLDRSGGDLLAAVMAARGVSAEQLAIADSLEFVLEERRDNLANVIVIAPNGSFDRILVVQIDGVWVPAQWAVEWRREMQRLRAQLAQLDPERFLASLFRMSLADAERALTRLER